MAGEVDIWNRALQKLGAARIASTSDQSVNARACSACYSTLRDWLYRAHPWNCAIQRFQLPADSTAPLFGPANSFTLPTGWALVLPPDPKQNFNDRDWTIESGKLLTNDSAPLNLRCVIMDPDTTKMDVHFREALACIMAYEMCEQLTQSNEKKAELKQNYKEVIAEAKKENAIEKVPVVPVTDTWDTARI